MAKSLKDQIDQISRDDEFVRKAQERREQNVAKIVQPIAEKIAGQVRAKLEEDLKQDVAKAGLIDLSRENLKLKIDAFVAGLMEEQKNTKAPKAKPAADATKAAPASGAADVQF